MGTHIAGVGTKWRQQEKPCTLLSSPLPPPHLTPFREASNGDLQSIQADFKSRCELPGGDATFGEEQVDASHDSRHEISGEIGPDGNFHVIPDEASSWNEGVVATESG